MFEPLRRWSRTVEVAHLASLLVLAAGLLTASALAGGRSAAPASAQTQFEFEDVRIVNQFPDRMIFRARARAEAGRIVGAELTYFSPDELSSVSLTRRQIEFEPGAQVDLEYVWDTQDQTVVPSTPLAYFWEVWDEEGTRARSVEFFVRYDDVRFNWDVQENDAVAVWTHDRPVVLGERAFEIASQAVRRQRDLFDAELELQVRLIVYNNFDEFAAWHSTVSDFVGGQAFPGYGITTQIVPLRGPQEGWLLDVVPHEIAHLYFAQVTHNPTVSVPVWLNEGVASYMEFSSQEPDLARARAAAGSGDIVPLSSLTLGFGSHDEGRARLAYDEALSAVVFMIERYGEEGLADLLAAYREGLPSERAFQRALGVGVGEFEAQWAAWLGVPEGEYATATPWPLPTFPASPTPGQVSGVQPTSPPATASPVPTANQPETESAPRPGVCASALILIPALGAVGWLGYRKRAATSR